MPSKTLSLRVLQQEEFDAYQDGARQRPLGPHPARPRTRAECKGGCRPCPFVSCRYHLFLDVNRAGGIVFNHGQDLGALATMKSTCALDVADQGPKNFWELADYFAITNEAVRLWYNQAAEEAAALATLEEATHG